MTRAATTERVRRVWDQQASHFDRQMGFWERILFPGDREWACSHASGDVLEIAVGTGRNLEHDPADARVTGIELSPEMLARARERAATVRPDADLRQGDAEQLPFGDDSFDTVVCTFSLCSIPDAERAVREMTRVVRPGGKVVLVEHVASPSVVVRAIQWLLHQVTYRLACEHMLRVPRHALAAAGLQPVHLERRKAGIVDRLMVTKPVR